MCSSSKIKVFIVDDHLLIIEGLRLVFTDQPDLELVGVASDGGSCMTFFKHSIADVILLDINLPDINGIDLCASLIKVNSDIRVLGLSVSHQKTVIQKMMEAGARGFLLKNSRIDEIREAIRQAFLGNIFISKEAGDALYRPLTAKTEYPQLTTREKEILGLVSTGFSAPQIAEMLFISQLTVESHKRNLMAKLKVKNTALLIRLAIELGLIE